MVKSLLKEVRRWSGNGQVWSFVVRGGHLLLVKGQSWSDRVKGGQEMVRRRQAWSWNGQSLVVTTVTEPAGGRSSKFRNQLKGNLLDKKLSILTILALMQQRLIRIPKLVKFHFLTSQARRLLLISVFTLLHLPVFSQLTDRSEVSIITVGPGKEVFTAFGHSALRISDPALNMDQIYNYGTFSFADGFYFKFTKGEMDFWLSVVPFAQEYYSWTILENRSLTQQTLNLSLKQKNDLFQFLNWNALPENRVYRYDYFYDNCSNRIDNALKKVLDESVKFQPEKVTQSRNTLGNSIRQLTHSYLTEDPWGELGIETCLGMEMDKKITPEQYKFLPDYLMWNYDEAITKSQGGWKPLVTQKTVLFEPTKDADKSAPGPVFVFSALLILGLVISLPSLHNNIAARLFDFSIFFVTGVIGMLILFLWFFTTHHAQDNLNILWASPLNLFVGFLFLRKRSSVGLIRFCLIYGIWLVVLVVFSPILPQDFNPSYLPIFLLLIVRCGAYYWFSKHPKISTN